ncbi:MAG TPA: nucleoside hydrolase [Candidatus Eisenbacteria bacterium]|nr:nucleoside hydrolase [Candidatus Eisenbacteria bacterium]
MGSPNSFQNRRQFLRTSAVTLAAGALPVLPSGLLAAESKPAARAAGSPSQPYRIILDTDPGVDDAIAIFLALRSPELKVEAVTPVSGNVPLSLTLPNALRLVEIAGRTDIPVAAGASEPLVRRLVTAKYAHGINGLGGVEFPEPKLKPVAETANEIMTRLIRANPHEISIVAIGPLTNVATVLKSDPSIAPLIKSIVIMGGSLSGGNITPAAEFNLYVDPEAARIVFDAGVPLTMIGLDVTRKVVIHEEQVRALEAAQNPVSQAAGKILRSNFERMRKMSAASVGFAMHDPLTIAQLIDPSMVTLTDYFVEIETSGELTAGETVGYAHGPVRRSPPMESGLPPTEPVEAEFKSNAKVAVDVEPDKFFRLLLARLTSAA